MKLTFSGLLLSELLPETSAWGPVRPVRACLLALAPGTQPLHRPPATLSLHSAATPAGTPADADPAAAGGGGAASGAPQGEAAEGVADETEGALVTLQAECQVLCCFMLYAIAWPCNVQGIVEYSNVPSGVGSVDRDMVLRMQLLVVVVSHRVLPSLHGRWTLGLFDCRSCARRRAPSCWSRRDPLPLLRLPQEPRAPTQGPTQGHKTLPRTGRPRCVCTCTVHRGARQHGSSRSFVRPPSLPGLLSTTIHPLRTLTCGHFHTRPHFHSHSHSPTHFCSPSLPPFLPWAPAGLPLLPAPVPLGGAGPAVPGCSGGVESHSHRLRAQNR